MTYEPFHIRERNRERQGQPVLYKYDELPEPFRVQVMRIVEQVIGDAPLARGVTTHYVDPNSEPFGPGAVWRIIGNQIADKLGSSTSSARGHAEFFNVLFRRPNVPV